MSKGSANNNFPIWDGPFFAILRCSIGHRAMAMLPPRVFLPENNSLGIVRIAFARLELREYVNAPNEAKRKEVIQLLKDGISLVTEYGSYARTDVQSRLAHVEKDFPDMDAALVREIGAELLHYVKDKVEKNSSYIAVVNIMNKWKNWKNEK